ncbi:site-specific integrase [Luteibacter anthropi]|uniref:tyrosine-type recombinase/integrase n=1 Tax=Luteibacter anthropi TaxID=564369 RepID=UPI0020328944|nr:site-specific integrase [Luteibacter anthropi]URX63737.1 site-specific integrase [Luteibacter anthropi]
MDAVKTSRINVRWTVTTSATLAFCASRRLPHPPSAFPLLVEESGRIVEAARAYMWSRYVLRVRAPAHSTTRNSPNTHRACASDLCQFFDALEEYECSIEDIDESVLNSFSAAHEKESPATGRPYAYATCLRRMGTVIDFVKWLQTNGLLRRRIDFTQVSTGERYVQSAHIDDEEKAPGRRRAHAKKAALVFHVILHSEAKVILHELAIAGRGSYSSDLWHAGYLGTVIALATGMRISEIQSLDVIDVLQHKPVYIADKPLKPYYVNVIGKGEMSRYVEFPGWLVGKLMNYINTAREMAVEEGRALYGPHYKEQSALLLNGPKSTVRRGMRVSDDTIYKAFHRTVKSLAARSIILKPYRFHDCRHTFATWTGIKYDEAGKTNPSLPVKNLLGHRSLSTTIGTYQNTQDLFRKSISEDLQRRLAILGDIATEDS